MAEYRVELTNGHAFDPHSWLDAAISKRIEDTIIGDVAYSWGQIKKGIVPYTDGYYANPQVELPGQDSDADTVTKQGLRIVDLALALAVCTHESKPRDKAMNNITGTTVALGEIFGLLLDPESDAVTNVQDPLSSILEVCEILRVAARTPRAINQDLYMQATGKLWPITLAEAQSWLELTTQDTEGSRETVTIAPGNERPDINTGTVTIINSEYF